MGIKQLSTSKKMKTKESSSSTQHFPLKLLVRVTTKSALGSLLTQTSHRWAQTEQQLIDQLEARYGDSLEHFEVVKIEGEEEEE